MTQTRCEDKGIPSATALDKGTVFKLLANDRRRLILHELYEHGGLDKSELIRAVAREEAGGTPSEKEINRVSVAWTQNHGPQLCEHGVIRRDDEWITLGPNAPMILEHLVDESSIARKLRRWF